MPACQRFFPLPILAALAAVLAFSACAPTKRFCPDTYTVDFTDALRFATYADQAYSEDTVVARECGQDSCFFIHGPVSDAHAFVRVNDSSRVQWIAFRGTKTFSDVKLDAEYTQTEDSILHMRLHRGFASAARDMYPLIVPHLRAGYRTRLSGHSLGGAIAVVTGLYLRAAGFNVDVQTFGQPKVTNAAGALRADSLNLTRFMNGEDLVTQVPPLSYSPGQLGSYEHFGREVELLDGKKYECLTEPYRKRYDPDSWWAQVQEQALKDHGIALYLEKLKALAPPVDAGRPTAAQPQAAGTAPAE